ncbi:MAG: sodium:proline symporter [Alphaproteobacteria bacterium]
MSYTLVAVTVLMAVASLALSPRVSTLGSFYKGHAISGDAPGVLSLSLSLVTTWIFARSIMNAAILGYFYGIAGALAYATYYLSFLTGAWIIASLRWRHGFDSIQGFLADRFGVAGPVSYSFVTGLRLLSEVFANLLVIGIIFGQAGSTAYAVSIVAVGLVVLAYSALGGLHASIRTDVLQMVVFLIVLGVLMIFALDRGSFDFAAIASSSPDSTGPGWVLLAVAFLQVWSYPMHDPVMMDRGLISDKKSTMTSFYHAAWLSVLCIMAFGLLGTYAGLEKIAGESFVPTLMRLFGETPVMLFNIALIISCMSTLDSTLASAAKLSIVDMNMAKPTVFKGRVAMMLFLLGGLALVFLGSKDLFSAVAVSGTASMFLAPVAFFSLWGGRTDVPAWSYQLAFVTAITGAVIYFLEAGNYMMLMNHLTGLEHKYSKLLVISASVTVLGCLYFAAGILLERRRA